MADQPGRADDDPVDSMAAATLKLLGDGGLEAVTPETVALMAGADVVVVLGRWPSMPLLAAFALRTCQLVPRATDTGTLRRDLFALMDPCTRELDRGERAAAVLLRSAAQHDAVLAALDDVVVTPLAATVESITDRHLPRRCTTSVRLLQVVVQSLWWERYAGGLEPMSADGMARLVDGVLIPIAEAG